MQGSFSFRVGKTFGSLPGSWSLGDEKIDRRECNRNNESPEPESELHQYHTYSTDDFCNELENGLLEFFDDKFLVQEEERGWFGQSFESKANAKTKPDDYEEEQWEIKTSIGLDLTLDSEDEEDGYDKLAVGMEDSVDRPDMNEYVNDDDETDSDEVPNLLKGFSGDPLEIGIKSLLKRTSIDDQLVTSTVEKRVRFRDEEEHEGSKDRWSAAVPDYIRNPSRYTHYMFDSSSDMDDKSNEQAYLNFRMQFSRLMKSDTMEAEEVACIAVSKPVALVPRKKSTDASKELAPCRIIAPCRIRPIAFPDTDDCEMEEDEPVTGSSSGPEEPACGELSPASFVQTPA